MLLRDAATSGTTQGQVELGRRVRWALAFAALIIVALVGRLWQLQVVRGDSYYQQTVTNVVHKRHLPSVRGKILDRKGRPLADNRPAFNLYVTPNQLSDENRSELGRMLAAHRQDEPVLEQGRQAGARPADVANRAHEFRAAAVARTFQRGRNRRAFARLDLR